jgi:hypothetical protein
VSTSPFFVVIVEDDLSDGLAMLHLQCEVRK